MSGAILRKKHVLTFLGAGWETTRPDLRVPLEFWYVFAFLTKLIAVTTLRTSPHFMSTREVYLLDVSRPHRWSTWFHQQVHEDTFGHHGRNDSLWCVADAAQEQAAWRVRSCKLSHSVSLHCFSKVLSENITKFMVFYMFRVLDPTRP